MSSIGGTASSLQSKRPRCAAGQRGGDAELQQEWRILGKPGGYEAPGEQELQDLADSRNRKRGEREQKRRLKANWQALERVAAAQPAEPEPTGPAVPPYLLERGMVQPVSSNVPTYIDVKALRARLRPSAAAARDADFDEDGQLTGAEADDSWLTGHLRHMAQREREFTAWHAEREAQIAQLDGADFYWAQAQQSQRKPFWQLRRQAQLEADCTCTVGTNELGVEEPLLLYRAFRPFTGDVLKAEQFFLACAKGGDAEARLAATEWLDSERAKLEPSEAGRPSKRRCIECNQLECICPGLDDPARYDMYGGGSADCGAIGLEEWQRDQLQAVTAPPAAESSDDRYELDSHELEREYINEEHGRISVIHGRPWHEVPPQTTAHPHWLDFVDRPWERAEQEQERAEREQERREEREHCERLERMTRANLPPPHRDDARYAPLASNAAGDEAFRKDRAVWYEHVTGESLDGLSVAEQWERVDAVARRFREYTDGRAPRVQDHVAGRTARFGVCRETGRARTESQNTALRANM